MTEQEQPRCAVYDNPASLRRESWENGKVIAFITATLLMEKGFNGHPRMFFAFNCGPWTPGKIWGDEKAIKDCEK